MVVGKPGYIYSAILEKKNMLKFKYLVFTYRTV